MRVLIGICPRNSDRPIIMAVAPEGMTLSQAGPNADEIVLRVQAAKSIGMEQRDLEVAFEAAGWDVWPYEAAQVRV